MGSKFVILKYTSVHTNIGGVRSALAAGTRTEAARPSCWPRIRARAATLLARAAHNFPHRVGASATVPLCACCRCLHIARRRCLRAPDPSRGRERSSSRGAGGRVTSRRAPFRGRAEAGSGSWKLELEVEAGSGSWKLEAEAGSILRK